MEVGGIEIREMMGWTVYGEWDGDETSGGVDIRALRGSELWENCKALARGSWRRKKRER